jgi:hypothetical protein
MDELLSQYGYTDDVRLTDDDMVRGLGKLQSMLEAGAM